MEQRGGGDNDSGFSLIETMVAIVILGFAVVALISGLGTTIAMSDIHHQQADANAVMVSAAERVKADPFPLTPCTPYDATTGVGLPSGWTAAAISTSIQVWDGSSFVPCTPDNLAANPFPLELVIVTVTSPPPLRPVTTSVGVVKRGP